MTMINGHLSCYALEWFVTQQSISGTPGLGELQMQACGREVGGEWNGSGQRISDPTKNKADQLNAHGVGMSEWDKVALWLSP